MARTKTKNVSGVEVKKRFLPPASSKKEKRLKPTCQTDLFDNIAWNLLNPIDENEIENEIENDREENIKIPYFLLPSGLGGRFEYVESPDEDTTEFIFKNEIDVLLFIQNYYQVEHPDFLLELCSPGQEVAIFKYLLDPRRKENPNELIVSETNFLGFTLLKNGGWQLNLV